MKDLANLTTSLPDNYTRMMSKVQEMMPRIAESSESFYKSSSQLKTVSLDITELTDIGAAKHILARIENKKLAIEEAELKLRKQRLKLSRKQLAIETATDEKAKDLELEILEIRTKVTATENYQRGALREVAFLVEQYEAICQKLGVEVITEEMYEQDQPKFHVMRAFSQGLAAARARGGTIDEGNFIYFQDLGINGAAAQREVTALLEMEQEMLDNEILPTFEVQREWLQAVANKYAPEVRRQAEYRGFVPFVPEVLAQQQVEA